MTPIMATRDMTRISIVRFRSATARAVASTAYSSSRSASLMLGPADPQRADRPDHATRPQSPASGSSSIRAGTSTFPRKATIPIARPASTIVAQPQE